MMIHLKNELPGDKYGNCRLGDVSLFHHDVSGNVSNEEIFTGNGILSHITIWRDVDGGTVQLTDVDGAAIIPAAVTDYGGSFMIKLVVTNGCRITTTGFVGGSLSIFYNT